MIARLVLAGAAAVVGYGVTAATMTLVKHAPAELRTRFDRVNHAGRTVSLSEGPAVALGLASAAALVPAGPARLGAVASVAAAGAFGAIDDFGESGSSKGLRGHLGALARGEVTTGVLKAIGIPVASVLSAAVALEPRPLAGSTFAGRCADSVLAGGVIAGTANLFNLLDLRPGRALKAGALVLALGTTRTPATSVLAGAAAGAIAAALPDDLAGRAMLGDTGANALGALLGARIALDGADRTRLAAWLAVLAGLTLASEKVSFTRVIENTPVLRDLDAWGR